MVRFFHLRKPRAGHFEGVLRRAGADAGPDRCTRLICGGVRVPAAWSAHLRSGRRPARAEGRIPHHRQPDGRLDLPDWLPSHLCDRGRLGADATHPAAHSSGDRARGRIWWSGDLRRRARAQPSARRIDRMDPVIGFVRPSGGAAGDRGDSRVDWRGRVCRLGLEGAIPGVRRAAGHFGMDARRRTAPPAQPPARR